MRQVPEVATRRGDAESLLDPRDPNEDGHVTIHDVAICAERCTHPHCRPVAGPSCGFLGVEALLPVAWVLRRLRRRR